MLRLAIKPNVVGKRIKLIRTDDPYLNPGDRGTSWMYLSCPMRICLSRYWFSGIVARDTQSCKDAMIIGSFTTMTMIKYLLVMTIIAALVPTAMSNVSTSAAAYSQVAELNNISTSTQTQTQTPVSTQCLDFNQDGICEYIILANGTQVANPMSQKTVVVQNSTDTDDGTKLWQRKLDGKVYTDITAYRHALEAKEDEESERWDEDEDDNDDKGDEEDDNDDEDIVYCEGQRVPEGADSCYDQYDFEEGDGSGCDDNDDYCNEEDECGRSDVDCIDDRNFDEDDYNG